MRTSLRNAIALAIQGLLIGTSGADVVGGPVVNPANDHAYYLLGAATWTDAEAQAVALGGHLATISDADEEAWVYATFGTFGEMPHYLWIGLTDAGSQGSFAWTSGEPVTYVNWAGGEPTNGTSEDYVYITSPAEPSDRAGFWNDIDNSPLLNGVVELDVLPTTSTTTVASTSTTTTSTTTQGSSTTTSTLAGCLAGPEEASFASIICRIEALVGQTEAESALGDLRAKLLVPLGKAQTRAGTAADACAGHDAKHAKSSLKKVVRQLIQYSHRLRSRAARRKIDEAVREPLAQTADGIQEDARALKETLACP